MNIITVQKLITELVKNEKVNMTYNQLYGYFASSKLMSENKPVYIPVYIKLTSVTSFSHENDEYDIIKTSDEKIKVKDYPDDGKLQLIDNPLLSIARGKLTLEQIQKLLSLSTVELIEEDKKYTIMTENNSKK